MAVSCRNQGVYFDCIAAFKAPYCWTSIKGGAHTRFVDSLDIYEARMSPTINRSNFEKGITFDFHMGLPQYFNLPYDNHCFGNRLFLILRLMEERV